MESRSEVQEFLEGKLQEDRANDGFVYRVRIKVNGEEEPFSAEVMISRTVRSTQPDGVEQNLNDADWTEIAKKKIKQEVRNRLLLYKSTTGTIRLYIDHREVGSLLLPDAL